MQLGTHSFPDKFISFRTGGRLKRTQHSVLWQTANSATGGLARLWEQNISRLTGSHRAADYSTGKEFEEGLMRVNAQTCSSTDLGFLTHYRPVVTICTTSLTFSNSTFCPECIYVFCVDLRTNSYYFPTQH